MRAILIGLILILSLGVLFTAHPAAAQDDWEAGLFTEARQLPLVSQAQTVRVAGGDAILELVQVFANEGDELSQADYRLHLPSHATVSAFGFWREDRLLSAELKEKEEARREHGAAAASGRATGLLQREGTIHSFSVFPVAARSLQQVAITIRLPVATERGRSHVLLPMDSFLGHASLKSTALVQIEADAPLKAFGVEGVPHETLARNDRGVKLTFSSDHSVELWWSEESPPLLVRADAVSLGDGSLGIQLRVALNDASSWTTPYRELVLLVDTSLSMRRRARAVADLVNRVLEESTVPVRLYSVAEAAEEVHGSDRADALRRLLSGREGFRARWDDLLSAAALVGCSDPLVRCVAVTDPQVDGLSSPRAAPFEAFFLADADELAHFARVLGEDALIYQPDVEPRAKLNALADELVLPVLEVAGVTQPGGELHLAGSPRFRVAEGGILRLFGTSRSDGPLELRMNVAGKDVAQTVGLDHYAETSPTGLAIRRGVYQRLLDGWMADYRLSRDPDLKRQIVDVSLREEIPTALTSLHAVDDTLPRTATAAPLLRGAGWLLMLLAGAAFVASRCRP
jgi:hypothetical protein